MALATQKDRPLAVLTPLEEDTLLLQSLHWTERFGETFRGKLKLLSETDSIDPMTVLGKAFTIRLDQTASTPPYVNGIVQSFQQGGYFFGFHVYYAEVVSWFELLKQVGGSRIFQGLNSPAIFAAIAAQRGFSGQVDARLSSVPRFRDYCVQYNESDYHFLSRLMEEDGIYYYFEHTAEQHTLVLADAASAHQPVVGYETLTYYPLDNLARPESLFEWTSGQEFATASTILSDYDFQQPRVSLKVQQNAKSSSAWQFYRYPGRYYESDEGQNIARVQAEAAVAHMKWIRVKSNLRSAPCGAKFTLQSHPTEALNQEYIICGLNLEASAESYFPGTAGKDTYQAELSLHPTSVPYRSQMVTTKPFAMGPQLAKVVGKSGEEIWTDSYGRIKVQFPWDLDGTNDDTSSCWIRVVQFSTGKGFGTSSVPRVGEEVIVQFIDGDVDRPIVVGRVYNAENMPPNTLPDDQAKTVFRTRSTKAGTVDAFHELTFDDTAGSELIYFHSEGDFQRVVENNDTLKVGYDKKKNGDQAIDIYNDQKVTIGTGSGAGSQTVEIEKDRTVTLHTGNDSLTIEKGNLSCQISQGTATIEAAQSITLKCGSSSIEITTSGITIKAGQIVVQGSSKIDAKAPEITMAADGQLEVSGGTATNVKAGGQLVIKGAIVMIN